MCFKCCLTLSLHALWILHDWWWKVQPDNSSVSPSLVLPLLSSVCLCLSFSLWMVLVILSSHASSPLLSIQVGAPQPTRWQIEIGMADHMIQRAHVPCAPCRRTLTSWVEPELVQWLCQCHLMFCLAVSIVCRALLLLSLLAWQPWV